MNFICDDCGKQDATVVDTFCPYSQEINDEEIPMYLCPDCYNERCLEI